MDLEYLSGLWQQDDGGNRYSIAADDLHESIRRSVHRLERRIRWRDWRELACLVLFGGVFFYTAFITMPKKLDTHWLEHWDWIFLGVCCWGLGGVFMRERRGAHKFLPRISDDVRTTLEKQSDSLRHQIKLMNRVGVWYILPFLVPWTLVVVRSFPTSWQWPYFVAGLCTFGLIILWNRWYAGYRLTPRLQANEQLLKEVS